MQFITAIMRPVSNACNLSCYYCYNKRELFPQQAHIMKVNVLSRVINGFIGSGNKMVKFLWHGGEPMIAGLDFFQNAVKLQRAAVTQQCHPVIVKNNLQTNGLFIDKEKAEFLISEKFHIGVSIDGPDYIHDQNRCDRFGNGSHKLVIDKIRMLKEMDGQFGALSVVTKLSLPHAQDIFNFFISEGLTNMHFSPYAEINLKTKKLDKKSITAREFGYFIVGIFEAWKALNDPSVKIRIVDNFLQGLLGGKVEICTFARNCGHHLLVEVSGDVFICGRNANNERFHVGNIIREEISDITASQTFQKIAEQMGCVSEICEKCKWLNLCKGGCNYYKTLSADSSTTNTEYFCEGYKIIIEKLEDWIRSEGVIPQYL
ncbi:MAG: SPASM domain-containing protein [Candidatus Azambacteria bacterium]|nr:SPASM domain-containing protein [Candidatus Azambacteria bacterium]